MKKIKIHLQEKYENSVRNSRVCSMWTKTIPSLLPFISERQKLHCILLQPRTEDTFSLQLLVGRLSSQEGQEVSISHSAPSYLLPRLSPKASSLRARVSSCHPAPNYGMYAVPWAQYAEKVGTLVTLSQLLRLWFHRLLPLLHQVCISLSSDVTQTEVCHYPHLQLQSPISEIVP